jgi:hypothetical protein
MSNEITSLIKSEGDHEEWLYERNEKYKCHIQRNTSMGVWCGYVAVPRGHPCFGMHYDAIHDKYPDLDVHGELTYAEPLDNPTDFNFDDSREERERKKLEASQKADYWELGFDCGHADDIVPHMRDMADRFARLITNTIETKAQTITYKNKTWVINETNELAEQLLQIEKGEKIQRRLA